MTKRLIVLAGVAVAIAAVIGVDWGGSLGTYLPCRRNWGWLPSYSPRQSPTESVLFQVGSTRVKVCYGSPRARGRKMIGGVAVPFGRLWRTGANEPTTIRTSGPIRVAGQLIADGKASLYTVPGPETWEVVLNRSTAQWGIESAYDPSVAAEEIRRTVLPVETGTEYQEAFAIAAEVISPGGLVWLVLRWENTTLRIPVEPGVKEDRPT